MSWSKFSVSWDFHIAQNVHKQDTNRFAQIFAWLQASAAEDRRRWFSEGEMANAQGAHAACHDACTDANMADATNTPQYAHPHIYAQRKAESLEYAHEHTNTLRWSIPGFILKPSQ